MKLRIQFEKLGAARFSSHRDVMRIFQRCFAAAGIPVAYSEGFHPHMRMSFAPPLKTGWEGYEEYVDLHVERPPGEIRDTCNARLPEGLRINRVCALAESAPKIAADVSAATMTLRLHPDDALGSAAPGADRRAEAVRELERRMRERFVLGSPVGDDAGEPRLADLSVHDRDGYIEIAYTTTMCAGRIVGPTDVSSCVGDPEAFGVPLRVARRAQFVERGGEFVSPISKGVLLNQS